MNIQSKQGKFIQRKLVLIIVAVTVIAGLITLQFIQAAGSILSLEPETGTLTSSGMVRSDSTASGGKNIVFGTQTPQPTAGFSFTAAGDHGNDTKSRRGMDVVGSSGSKFYLALGDMSYQSGAEDEWCAAFKQRFNDVEVLAGNHDVGESYGGDINRYRQYCPFTLGSLTGDYGKQYYFNYPMQSPLARFIMIAPGVKGSLNINYNRGGAGYTFTENAINSARQAGIKWIVVGMHKNCISVGNKSCEIGTDIMNLFISKKVDLVLQSHDHNYQRSHALSCITTNSFNSGCVADSGSDGTYVKDKGPVVIINGEFGRTHYPINSSDSERGYFAKTDSTTFGVTKYTITADSLTAKYLRSDGGTFADSFSIDAASP